MKNLFVSNNNLMDGTLTSRVLSRISGMRIGNRLAFIMLMAVSSVNAWGYTWTAKVGVSQGKGSVKIQIYNNATIVQAVVAESAVATTTTLKSCSTSVLAATTYGWPICVVVSESTGYTFEGWYDSNGTKKSSSWTYETASGSLFDPGWRKTWTLTYYAKFTANSYDVTLNPNGGTGSNQTISATYDAAMPSKLKNNNSIVAPTRAGYTFLGYFDAQNGGKKYYNADLSSAKNWDKTPTGTATLYAQWQENTYTITWPTIESGLVYTPGEIVQNHFATTGSAVDGTTAVAGTFTCSTELQPALNSTGYTVTFTPTNTNKYLSHFTTIKQDVAKADQYITWDLQDGKNAKDQYYEYAQGEVFKATSYRLNTTTATGLTVTYTSSDNTIATVVGNELQVHTVGQVVTITASCVDANGNWNDAETVSKTFKTCGVKPNTFEVIGTGLTYGQFLSASTLSGTVSVNGGSAIPGTFSWVEPNTFPSAGQNQSFDVLFTPDNTDAFGSVTFPVTINVAKATPTITWNIGNNLRAESPYNNFVTANNSEASFTITTSSNSLLNVDGMKLTTGSVTNATTGWIRVSLPETDNFNALTNQQLNVTVNPKSDVCLPITTMDAEMYDRTFVSGTDDASWSDEGLLGIGMKYYMLYTIFYTRRTGIQLGDWTEGFTGIDVDMETYSEKSVVLTFNGSPKDISFDVETQYVYVVKSSGIGLGLTFPYPATFTNWYLYESADGANFTQVGSKFNSSSTEDESNTHINRSLKPETRYVKIVYSGNFAGWVKNLQITKRDGYLTADQSLLTFGTNAHPLQDPQAVTISYGALGTCGQTGAITASIDNPHFYLDETNITNNVGFDYNGEYTVRVRCNEVGQTGTLTFTAFDGTKKTVSLTSTTPELTSAGSSIFKTGTEHVVLPGSAYRTNSTIDYTQCFDGAAAKFDTLYIYGVSESSAANRLWDNDASKGYNVPALNVAEGNVYTPCFVYAKNNNKYVYARTCDATRTLTIAAAGKKLGFIGYRPANMATAAAAIQLNGAAGEQTELYLSNAEIVANGVAVKANSSSDAAPFALTIFARGNNILNANAAAIQLSAKSSLTIEDSWKNEASGVLALRSATGYPSIDLGGDNSVTINGTQLELHNGTNMAIAHMAGATELADGEVRINDGTILGETLLGLPHNTLIDGGTFNAGNVVCYTANGKTVRPFNSRGDILARQTMTVSDLASNYGWYGQAHLVPVGANVHPMLFGAGEGLCIFEATVDDQSYKDDNWSTAPESASDAIVVADMQVTDTLTVNSLTINEGVTVTVANGATLSIGDGDSYRTTAGNLHVENGGNVILHNGQLNVNDFILDAELGSINENTSTPSASGQVMGEQKLNVSGDAYFRLTLDPLSGRNTLGWYDFVLPFEVDVIGGISMEGDDTPLVFDVNYAVMNYTEAKRAQNGKDWNKYRGTMEPGRIYTIGVDDDYDWNTVIFKKKAGAAVTGDRSFTTEYSGLAADDKDNGWNGFGNGTLHHTELNVPDSTYVQIYDHANRCYRPHLAKDYSIAVGASFFMQVDGVETISLLTIDNKNHGFLAPARTDRNVEKFQLALQAEGAANVADQLWVSASEEATGKYVIGRDLLKMGNPTESKVARMWSTRNDTRLCVNEMTLSNGVANCELSLFAPETKEYTLSVEAAPEEATLYLTYNNRVIWNLSYAPYVFDLSKGTTEGYGLRLVAEAPQMHTDIDETGADAQGVKKVMIDNVLYLVTPQGAMYDINGKIIK